MAYHTLISYTALTIAPAEYTAQVEVLAPGWLLAQLDYWSSWIDSRLKKRYATPFAAPPDTPIAITGWLARVVDYELFLKRGVNPDDAQMGIVRERALEAKAEVKEAADSAAGLFELPLKLAEPAVSGVSRGGPLMISEVSPYTWSHVQRDIAADEDCR